jgi:hypothetical protein
MSLEISVNIGAKYAKKIRREFNRLSSTFKLKMTHPSVEKGYDPTYKSDGSIDYSVLFKGRCIATLDVSAVDYQLLDYNAPHYSKIMPVKRYKGKRDTPFFIVYHMLRETEYGLPLKNACVWIKGKDVIKSRTETRDDEPFPENQDNYYTDHKDWHRGLESLIKELAS